MSEPRTESLIGLPRPDLRLSEEQILAAWRAINADPRYDPSRISGGRGEEALTIPNYRSALEIEKRCIDCRGKFSTSARHVLRCPACRRRRVPAETPRFCEACSAPIQITPGLRHPSKKRFCSERCRRQRPSSGA